MSTTERHGATDPAGGRRPTPSRVAGAATGQRAAREPVGRLAIHRVAGVASAPANGPTYLVVEIDGARYALAGGPVRGVARAEEIRHAPGAGGLAGQVRSAGAELPVLDLPACLGFGSPVRRRYAVVVEPGVALAVDAVVRREPVTPDRLAGLDVTGLPLAHRSAYVGGDDEVVVVLDPASLQLGERQRGGRFARRRRPLSRDVRGAEPDAAVASLVAVELQRSGSGEFLALALGLIEEIVRVGRVRPLLGAPLPLAGLVAWRDRALLVADPALALGLPPTRQSRQARAVVVRLPGGRSLGLLSPATPERVVKPETTPLDDVAIGPLVRGAYAWERGRLYVLDPAVLLEGA